jgi:hypothetical protein
MNRIANLSEYICACIARTQEGMEEAEPDSMKSKAQFFANIVNGILYKQYEKVAPLNGVLSRAQEFDADKYACEIAGTDACVSALSKIEEFSKRWDNYLSYVEYHMKQNKIVPESVLTLYKHFSSLYDNVETRPISPETVYEAPVTHFSSRLNYAIDTSTHPSTEARCEAVRNLPFVKTQWNIDPATSYLKGSLDTYIHDSIIKPMMEKSPQTPFVKKELTNEYIQNDIKEIVPAHNRDPKLGAMSFGGNKNPPLFPRKVLAFIGQNDKVLFYSIDSPEIFELFDYLGFTVPRVHFGNMV